MIPPTPIGLKWYSFTIKLCSTITCNWRNMLHTKGNNHVNEENSSTKIAKYLFSCNDERGEFHGSLNTSSAGLLLIDLVGKRGNFLSFPKA